ncbi:MAG: tRNA (adenosine(37)-N6)-threonylcarbamoyltransferase complex transferase subunit TsaD [Ignavibacteria bacterium]|nr:tRNA (adenosine(37)-N6)-threonylcarbamoyltransferase complex transferase subunit TsaD [Ignavibacteria bacterium]
MILAIETSCDETSAAILSNGAVLSNVISSQMIHSQYGGVVPELASRAHLRALEAVTNAALRAAGIEKNEITGVAATSGPGLAGALLVGLMFGKGIACSLGVPFVGVNHLEGHLYSNSLGDAGPEHPFLCLIVSGGHTALVLVRQLFEYQVLGQTRDDAAGEAFDKVAKMLGLGYPGGPLIDKLAQEGNPEAVRFPRSFLEEGSLDFSFSGLKTAVLYHLRDRGLMYPEEEGASIDRGTMADVAASFQEAVVDVLSAKTIEAATRTGTDRITIAGGVSANSLLRSRMQSEAARKGMTLHYPRAEYCMDNAAMIGYVGWLRLKHDRASGLELGVEANLVL